MCNNCGECCQYVMIRIDTEKTNIEWLKLHGIEVDVDMAKINLPCSALKNNKCTIYESRPDICRNFNCIKSVLDDFPDLKN